MRAIIGPYPENDEERKIDIHIDDYDLWGMDHTLALIILPMLKMLKDKKQGTPHVDNEDLPEELRATKEEIAQWNIDGTVSNDFPKRWEWVMNQMIFSFESIVDDSWEDQFFSGEHDYIHVPVDKHGNPVDEEDAEYFEMKPGPNHTAKFDKDGYFEYNERIENGLKLFGKYFRSLWS